MSRLNLKCACGWVFFVSSFIEGDVVVCPSCGAEVPLPKKRDSARLSGWGLPMIGLMGGIAAIVLGVAYFIFAGGNEKPAPENPEVSAPVRTASTRRSGPSTSGPAPARPAPDVSRSSPSSEPAPEPETRPEPEPEAEIDPFEIDRTIERLNVAGLVRHLLFLRGLSDKVVEVERRMTALVGMIDDLDRRLARRGKPHAYPRFLKPGDQILRIGSDNLEQKSAEEASRILAAVLHEQVRAGNAVECAALRSGEILTILMSWTQTPKDVRVFYKIAELPPPAEGTPAADAPPGPETAAAAVKTKLEADLLDRARKATQGVPPYYRRFLLPEERRRLDFLLNAGEGTADDEAFLRERVLDQFASDVAAELAMIDEQVAALGKAADEAAHTDVVEKKDGSRLEGRILEEKADGVKFERKVGALKAVVTLKPEEIAKITRGAGAGSEFPERLKKAGNDAGALVALAGWCRESGLKGKAEPVAWLALKQDPDQAEARKLLGFAKGEGDRWIREEILQVQAGKVLYQGSWYTPEDLEKRLAAQGNVKLDDGCWYAKKKWTFSIGNVSDDRRKLDLEMNGASIRTMGEVQTKRRSDLLGTSRTVEVTPVVTGWCIAAVGHLQVSTTETRSASTGENTVVRETRSDVDAGTARIRIKLPGPILTCRVKALGQVAAVTGSIEVSVIGDRKNEPHRLYSLVGGAGTASDDATYDVSEVLRGETSFVIEASLHDEYQKTAARFLPGGKGDFETLKVTADTGLRMEAVNRSLGLAPKPTAGAAPAAAASPPQVPAPAAVSEDSARCEQAVAKIVEDVLQSTPSFIAAVTRIQQEAAGLRYPNVPQMPVEFQKVTRHITDPATFQAGALDAESAMEIGGWWDKAGPDLRRRFLKFFGLWCAARNQ